jgi:hypothetical protein
MQATCEFCAEPLDADKPGTYQHVSGWEQRRAQGGTNAIRLPQRALRFAHGPCVDLAVRGLSRQGVLPGFS